MNYALLSLKIYTAEIWGASTNAAVTGCIQKE